LAAHLNDSRIKELFEAAGRAFANGRASEAEGLLRQARNEAPGHPLVLNEVAAQMLAAGNASGAHDLLQRAIAADPSHASIWLNLAAALRGLGRADDEMAALTKALALEPRNIRARLQVASLHEMKGEARTAAAAYRVALQLLPPGLEPPPAMRPVLQHAREVVEANGRALEAFLESRLATLRTRHAGESLARFDRCLATLLQKRRIYRQQPTFMYYPNLPAIEFYERADFPWLDAIEAATDDIRNEITNVLAEGQSVLQPYISVPEGGGLDVWRELNNSRRWGVYYLWREGVPIPEHQARCPRTMAALESWPRCEVPGCSPVAVFSILDPKTRIPPHTGVNNTRLIVHIPLIIPPGCGLRVGAEQREWHPGHALIFDDTIEHEAWNDSDVPRAVLILDAWNPFLTPAERDMVSVATAAVGEYYGTRLYKDA